MQVFNEIRGKGKLNMKKPEFRSVGKVREVGEQGIVSAYLTKWGTVDAWGTQFEKGAFKESFESRGAKGTRLIWNHTELAGKVLSLGEDETGPFAEVQFNLETRAGKEAYEHVKAGDVECFSFGFNTQKDRWIRGVRSVQKVDMLECGPVVFQANDEAVITDVRSTDFNKTVDDNEVSGRGWKLIDALDETICDIYWASYDSTDIQDHVSNITSLVDTAISDFHTAYMQWLDEYYNQFETRETAIPPREIRNKIQFALNQLDVESLTAKTSLTDTDMNFLKSGKVLPFESRAKLADLPEDFQKCHKEERHKNIEGLCNEIRASGFSAAEKERFAALLGINDKTENEDIGSFFSELRTKLFTAGE